jgi:hypothetical protein
MSRLTAAIGRSKHPELAMLDIVSSTAWSERVWHGAQAFARFIARRAVSASASSLELPVDELVGRADADERCERKEGDVRE